MRKDRNATTNRARQRRRTHKARRAKSVGKAINEQLTFINRARSVAERLTRLKLMREHHGPGRRFLYS